MIPTQYHRLKIFAVATLAAATAIASASAFQIDLEPLFKGNVGTKWNHPIAVDLQNDGPAAKGVLHLSGVGFSMDYPVDLPHGATKRVIAYTIASYGETRASLDTDQGSASKSMMFAYSPPDDASEILMIGDAYGSLGFMETRGLQQVPNGPNDSAVGTPPQLLSDVDCYCKPEDAPPRAVGYSSIQTIVLAPGAERLSDESVAALKTWTLEGGTLVFLGLESSPILTDARWQALLPATRFEAKTFKTSDALDSIGQRELADPVTLLEPVDAHGVAVRSDGKTTISTESGFGVGRVVYLAFDPFSPELKDWAGLSTAMSEILRTGISGDQQQMISRLSAATVAGQGLPNPQYGSSNQAADDPFNAKLPPSTQVLEILGAYFLAVIPLNFLVLRKFKRAELAWFTAPVLSLAFASVLFRSAGHLYSEKLSTATQGIVLVHPAAPSGIFIGDTTMFIPNGGRYDLGMKGVDSIGDIAQPGGDPFFRDHSSEFNLNPVDNGQITVPNMLASNLAFREISYRQQVPLGNLYSLSMHRVGANAVCEITNKSEFALTNGFVSVGKHSAKAGTIGAGETKTIYVDLTKTEQPTNLDGVVNSMESTLGYFGGAALQANLVGFRPGPQIGEQVDSRSQMTLFVFSKDALGGIR